MGWTYEQFKQAILDLINIDLSSYKEADETAHRFSHKPQWL